MKTYQIYRQQTLPITIEEAWTFFSSPYNLQKITPSEMNFKIISPVNEPEIFEGLHIEYRLSPILHIPFYWTSVITNLRRPYSFTDIQKKGPYALWEHKHSFRDTDNGTEVTDEVKYALPLGIIGSIVNSLIINKQLRKIFDFRETELKKIFK